MQAAAYGFGSSVDTATSAASGPTTSASPNVKGSWSELIASTPFASGFAIVQFQSGASAGFMADIGIGGSGSEHVIIPDLQMAQRYPITRNYEFPIYIPQGTRIAARAQDDLGFATPLPLKLTLLGSSLTCPGPGQVTAYGATASSKGTNVDPGGSANTKSGWVEITPATARHHNWLTLSVVIGDNSAASNTLWLLDLGIGGSGSESVLLPDLILGMSGIQDYETIVLNLPVSLPAGTRISCRAQHNATTDGDRDLYVKLYGV